MEPQPGEEPGNGKNSTVLKSFSPFALAKTQAELLPAAPLGAQASFIYGESIRVCSEGALFTLHLLMDRSFLRERILVLSHLVK